MIRSPPWLVLINAHLTCDAGPEVWFWEVRSSGGACCRFGSAANYQEADRGCPMSCGLEF